MTILNATPIMVVPTWLCLLALFTLTIGATVAVVSKFDPVWLGICGLISAVFGIVLFARLSEGKYDVDSGHVEYEVLISDETSFDDIMKDYDVIEQRGDIWVLRDKEPKT